MEEKIVSGLKVISTLVSITQLILTINWEFTFVTVTIFVIVTLVQLNSFFIQKYIRLEKEKREQEINKLKEKNINKLFNKHTLYN